MWMRSIVVAGVATAAVGSALAQDAGASHDSWQARENAATAAAQRQAEADRIAAAAKVCAEVAVYWAQRHMPYDVDACLTDPAGAQSKVAADQRQAAAAEIARQQATYQAEQAEYARQQAQYQQQLKDYQRRMAEYNTKKSPGEKPQNQ